MLITLSEYIFQTLVICVDVHQIIQEMVPSDF
jgi:hypothetical protein